MSGMPGTAGHAEANTVSLLFVFSTGASPVHQAAARQQALFDLSAYHMYIGKLHQSFMKLHLDHRQSFFFSDQRICDCSIKHHR